MPLGLPLTNSSNDTPDLDIVRLIEVLDRHGVEYLVVGGIGAQAYGATRLTKDLDCLALRSKTNLERLAAAMRELNARLRVEGLSDAEAAQLPVQLDAQFLIAIEISTWRTDAGDFDLLTDIPAKDGRKQQYEDLAGNARPLKVAGRTIQVAGLGDIVASKEWANRPKDREALPELHELLDKMSQGPKVDDLGHASPPDASCGLGRTRR